MFKYSISLAWSDEDEGYIALVPELPGLSAFGETPEEAAQEAEIAAKGFLNVYEEDGEAIPEPRKLTHFSGQFRLRLPKSLHASLSQEAKKEGVSLNGYVSYLLAQNAPLKVVTKKLSTMENVLYTHVLQSETPRTQSSGSININFSDHHNLDKAC